MHISICYSISSCYYYVDVTVAVHIDSMPCESHGASTHVVQKEEQLECSDGDATTCDTTAADADTTTRDNDRLITTDDDDEQLRQQIVSTLLTDLSHVNLYV